MGALCVWAVLPGAGRIRRGRCYALELGVVGGPVCSQNLYLRLADWLGLWSSREQQRRDDMYFTGPGPSLAIGFSLMFCFVLFFLFFIFYFFFPFGQPVKSLYDTSPILMPA